MQKLRLFLEILAYLAFITFILIICYYTLHIAPKIKQTVEDTDRAVIIAAGAATNVELGARQWKAQSESQAKSSTETFQNLSAAASSLNSLISSTNKNLNLTLLPSLSKAISDQNTALLTSEKDLQDNLAAIGQVTVGAQQTIADADKAITDPAIKVSLSNLAEATKQLDIGMEQTTAIAADGRQVADKFRETYLKPQKFAWELLKQLVGLGGSMAQMIK